MNTTNTERSVNTFPVGFKASNDFLGILKDLIIDTALNTSGYRLGVLFEPYNLASEPLSKCCLIQMRVSGEALAQVTRMAKLDQMEVSFNRRSVALKQTDPETFEITYNLMLSDEPDSLVHEEVDYYAGEPDDPVGRQIELAAKDIFEFLMHGTLKGEEFGDQG